MMDSRVTVHEIAYRNDTDTDTDKQFVKDTEVRAIRTDTENNT
jgi:hypothetical protein